MTFRPPNCAKATLSSERLTAAHLATSRWLQSCASHFVDAKAAEPRPKGKPDWRLFEWRLRELE